MKSSLLLIVILIFHLPGILGYSEPTIKNVSLIKEFDNFVPGHYRFNYYPQLEEIYQWLDTLQKTHPRLVKIENIGLTYQKKLLKVAKIGLQREGPTKKAYWVDGGTHAREWVSVTTAMYFISQLIVPTNKGKDAKKLRSLLRDYDFYVMPVSNPDGYAYTQSQDRLWRKNRQELPGTNCTGIDINRNYGHKSWGTEMVYSSANPCDETYAGIEPFSSLEAQSIRRFFERQNQFNISRKILNKTAEIGKSNRIISTLSMHSYANVWIMPYAYTRKLAADYYELHDILQKALIGHTEYSISSIGDTLYLASGSALDWFYDNMGIKYVFGVELYDPTFTNGFKVPEQYIKRIARSAWNIYWKIVGQISQKEKMQANKTA